MSVWEFYEKKAKDIEIEYPDTLTNTQIIIENLWNIHDKMNVDMEKQAIQNPKELDPEKQFVLVYFIRNIYYLISAYVLSSKGLINPARNVTRTVYEQILRSIFFIAVPEEAKLLYDYIETMDEDLRKEIANHPRRFWSFNYIIEILYKDEKLKGHKDFYAAISRFSHPSINSLWSDYRNITEVEDTLRGIQGLTFNALAIFQMQFSSILSPELDVLIKQTKDMIGIHLKEIEDFKPNNI